MDYTTVGFCKGASKKIEQPQHRRSYFGLAAILAKEIRDTKSDVIYSPILKLKKENNPYHSDIKIGYIPEKGKQLPSEFQEKVNKIAETARLFVDPDPNSANWTGEKILLM